MSSASRSIWAFKDFPRNAAVVDWQDFQIVDMRDTSADVTKASRILGWTPLTSPDKGFQLNAEWHKREAAWLENIVM